MTERNVILVTLFLWAILYLPVGFFVSFNLGVNDTAWTVVALLLLFAAPLPLAIFAFKFPRFAGCSLLFCATTFLVVMTAQLLSRANLEQVVLGVAKFPYYLPHFIFGALLLTSRIRRHSSSDPLNHVETPFNG